ncbi:hypothetical protein Tco_0676370 [Tanacetum coccineum]
MCSTGGYLTQPKEDRASHITLMGRLTEDKKEKEGDSVHVAVVEKSWSLRVAGQRYYGLSTHVLRCGLKPNPSHDTANLMRQTIR